MQCAILLNCTPSFAGFADFAAELRGSPPRARSQEVRGIEAQIEGWSGEPLSQMCADLAVSCVDESCRGIIVGLDFVCFGQL